MASLCDQVTLHVVDAMSSTGTLYAERLRAHTRVDGVASTGTVCARVATTKRRGEHQDIMSTWWAPWRASVQCIGVRTHRRGRSIRRGSSAGGFGHLLQ